MNHAQAVAIIRSQWPLVHGRAPTANEVLFTQAVAWLETQYGRAGQFAAFAAAGKYNWANIEKARTGDECPAGWLPGKDSASSVCFRVYDSDEEAARALIATLTKRHWPTLAAMADPGTAEAVAHAMKVAPAYYSAPEETYATALRNAIRAIGQAPTAPSNPELAVASSGVAPIVAAAAGLAAVGALGYYLRSR